jgi:YD repeat-containing protein
VRRTDELGVEHHYAYDALGRIVQIETPEGGHTGAFDGFGRVDRVTRDGVGAIAYGYDPGTGLPTLKQRLDNERRVIDSSVTSYDAIGRPLQISKMAVQSPSSEFQFEYDGHIDTTTLDGQLPLRSDPTQLPDTMIPETFGLSGPPARVN